MFIPAYVAGTRERLRLAEDYATVLENFLVSHQSSETGSDSDALTNGGSPDQSGQFFWNAYVVSLVSLLEERLREAWRSLKRHGRVSTNVSWRLAKLLEDLEAALPGAHPKADPLASDIDAIIRIRNQIVHADGDDAGLSPNEKDLLALRGALNTYGEDHVAANAAFGRFSRMRINEYLDRVITLLPSMAKEWPTL